MIISKLTLVKSIHQVAKKLPFLHWLKSISRPIISPLNIVLSYIPQNANLIDIGCGNGTLLHLAYKFSGIKYAYGYDILANNIKNSITTNYPKSKVLVEYKDKMPSLDKFTTITLLDVLHHLPVDKQFSFIKEIIDKMGLGDIFILMDINASNFIGKWANQLHDLIINKEWVNPRKIEEIKQLFNATDVEIISSSKHQNLWYGHYLFIVKKQ